MHSRRLFLQQASLAMAAMATFDLHAAISKTGPLGKPVGLQLYTLGKTATDDIEGALRTLAQIGYREIEFAGGPPIRPAAELRKLLAANELTCPSIHASMMELQADAEAKVRLAGDLGASYLVCSFPWTADSRFKDPAKNIAGEITLDDWKWNAEQMNRIGKLAKQADIRFGYHNHNMEFRSYNGVVAFDEILRLTDPSLVTIELDIAWVVTGGADPQRYLREHASRIELLHVKEVRKDLKVMTEKLQAQTTELGNGKIDWPTLFAAMDAKRVRHYFVEQENFERPPLESARISFDYLQRLGSQAKS
jgi:sugar phosphate isomerase/epimerase